MIGRAVPSRIAPAAVAAMFVDERTRDQALVAIPRPEIQIVVRFGPMARGGLDAHAFGMQPKVRRKTLRAGQRTITARLHLGAAESVLGVPATAIAGRIVELEALWGAAATRRLFDQLAAEPRDAAAIVERAIADRLTASHRPPSPLALAAAERLAHTSVHGVAGDLGVSERHLRRLFRDAVGMSPKAFAKLARFHRALGAARASRRASWATIAVATGYYDQAHLIDEFRAIAGVTPPVLLGELTDS